VVKLLLYLDRSGSDRQWTNKNHDPRQEYSPIPEWLNLLRGQDQLRAKPRARQEEVKEAKYLLGELGDRGLESRESGTEISKIQSEAPTTSSDTLDS
jgi:hypothetical protein